MTSFNPNTPPDTGVLGLIPDTKETGKRVDFKPDEYDNLIEAKGYRLAWSRAGQCPCTPVTEQDKQPDPSCAMCGGNGWFFFRPTDTVSTEVGTLDAIQTKIVADNTASVIRGIMANAKMTFDPVNVLGKWQAGDMSLTVRHPNKLGFYDKIVNLDATIAYQEVFEALASEGNLEAKYLMTSVNLLRSVDTVYVQGTDFIISTTGQIEWIAGQAPSTGTRLVCHYLCHPTWLVIDHPHAVRLTQIKFKKSKLLTPAGDPSPLPIQATVRYEFV